jgi:hypothetical protein
MFINMVVPTHTTNTTQNEKTKTHINKLIFKKKSNKIQLIKIEKNNLILLVIKNRIHLNYYLHSIFLRNKCISHLGDSNNDLSQFY